MTVTCSHTHMPGQATSGVCFLCIQAEIDRAFLEAQRKESETIAALRAKLEQAEARVRELEQELKAERGELENQVRELELENNELAHAASSEGDALREFRNQRDRLQRVVDAFRAWLPTRRNAPDWTTIAMIEDKLDALLREGK